MEKLGVMGEASVPKVCSVVEESYDAKGVVSSGILLRWCGTGGESWRKHEKVIDNIIFFNFL